MLATDNFKLFCQLMTQLNIDLEQEVLKMLMETTNQSAASPRPSAPAAAKKGGQSRDKTDAEVLAQVIRYTPYLVYSHLENVNFYLPDTILTCPEKGVIE